MSKFGNVAKTKASLSTIKTYEIIGIGSMPDAKLMGKVASRMNTAYTNACLTASMSIQRKLSTSKEKGQLLNKNQANKIAPLSSYVITGWSGIVDDKGKEVAFSTADCIDLLNALPSSIFDEIVLFFETEANFMDTPDVEDVAKN